MRRGVLRAALLTAALGFGAAASAEMASPGLLASTCIGCHGVDGVSQGPAIPSIAGMSELYFVNAMLAYKYGEDREKIAAAARALGMDVEDVDALKRPATIMDRIAKGYSDEAIGAMAAYYAAKPLQPAKQQADATLAAQGRSVHREACEKCHEDGGRKESDGAGILAGQWKPYLQHALMDFAGGRRDMPKDMREKLENLSERDVDALIHFYASQNHGGAK